MTNAERAELKRLEEVVAKIVASVHGVIPKGLADRYTALRELEEAAAAR
jgi:hypothetical protein